jgi:peptidoglycan/LPS O-acetylase OafA/YrhL
MIKEHIYRYAELDSLRGLAALLVVLFHLTIHTEQSHLGFNLGVTGVDLFFIISGFVIFMSINSISSTKEFIINRFTRLYPTYWTCVSFTFILYFIVNKISNIRNTISFTDYLANLTMFQSYFKISNIDGPYWTMIIEMLFYIFIAIIFSIKQSKYIIPIGVSVLLIISIQNLIAKTEMWPWYSKFREVVPLIFFFPLFFSGILFYKLLRTNEKHFLYYLLLLFAFILQILNLAGDGEFITQKEHIAMTVIYFGTFILFVNKKLSFIVSCPFLFFGKISFALYLIHQYISCQVLLPYLIGTCHINFWIAVCISLAVVIVLATLITYYIEIPLGKRMNNSLRSTFNLQKNKIIMNIKYKIEDQIYIGLLKKWF